ncbi:MAG TPA: phosphoribosyltransferase family protein [Ramlibacter sp.]|nr:phosphoribosyltransferase family protein [Ramlibacter sp.]
MSDLFTDRAAAGRALADRLQAYAGREDVVVLALPRGGVPVASEVARALHAPLDLLIVRKLGVPRRPQLAMGAIASGGASYIDPKIMADCGVSTRQLDEIIAAESLELIRRHALYCGKRAAVPVEGRTVIVVDDGVATGASMRAALVALRSAKPAWIVVAVPVAPPEAQELIGTAADEFLSVLNPPEFGSVAQYYRDFGQIADEQVRNLIARAPAA